MDPLLGASIISGGTNLISQAISPGLSRRKAGRQFAHNRKLAEYSFDRQYQMWDEAWNRETEYNDPSAQMARYRNAGINPHMAYMSGGGQNTAQTGALPQYNQAPNDVGGMESIDLGGVVDKYLSSQMAVQELRKSKAQTRQEEANAKILEGTAAKTISAKNQELTKKEYRDYMDWNSDTTVDSGKSNLTRYQKQAKESNDITGLQNKILKAESTLKEAQVKNIMTTEQILQIQAQIQKATFDFLKEDWFQELPPAVKAVFMGLASTFAGIK